MQIAFTIEFNLSLLFRSISYSKYLKVNTVLASFIILIIVLDLIVSKISYTYKSVASSTIRLHDI